MMNDASLSMAVVPLKGVKTFDQLLPAFLERTDRSFKATGGSLERRNQTIIALRRSGWRLIGPVNERPPPGLPRD